MKIALIDDETHFFDIFKKELENLGLSKVIDVECFDNLTEEIVLGGYEIILLDVMMYEKESFKFGEKLKKLSPHTVLVYISNTDTLIHKSICQDIFFFIRKSHLREDLVLFFKKYNDYQLKHGCTLDVHLQRHDMRIPQYKILYIETQKNKLVLHLHNEQYELRMLLKDIFPLLDSNIFYHFNRYIIINLERVLSVEKNYILMSNKEKIYFSRGSKPNFTEAYMEFKEKQVWNC